MVVAYRTKKRLGQNFLTSDAVIRKIIDVVEPGPDQCVVEIGAGRGALTVPLAESGAAVLAIEFDRDIIRYLTKLVGKYDNVRILNEDFLRFEPGPELRTPFKLVGNLPFNITSPVVDWCVGHCEQIDLAVLMVQKELAERLAASPGCKAWSPLSIMTQLHFQVDHCFNVARDRFKPPPEVTAAVIKLMPRPCVLDISIDKLNTVLRASFQHRRKLLTNNLTPYVIPDTDTARQVFEAVGLSARCRAEQVTLKQFLKLTKELLNCKLV